MTVQKKRAPRRAGSRQQLLAGGLLALLTAGCSAAADTDCIPADRLDASYQPVLDPANFSATVNHPMFQMSPGMRWVYEGGGEQVEVTVTDQTKTVLGIPAVVVRDVVTEDGEVIEDTFDWFAQDDDGNVWYLGEDSRELEGGQVVSTEGSWEAGVDGALPGIIMPAMPAPGPAYRQEYKVCEAEDMAEVVSTAEAVTVPYASFLDCLQTHDFTPLEPGVSEHKYYCEGVGLTLEVDVNTGERLELVEFEFASGP